MMADVKGSRRWAAAALGALALAACKPGAEGGFARVPYRDAPVVPRNAHPDPPPVLPGTTVGAPVARVVARNLPAGVTQAMVDAGQQAFNGGVCVGCHGPNGVGTSTGPALNDAQWIQIRGEFAEILATINSGVPAPREFAAPMPARGGGSFTDEQVRSLAAYVYALSHQGGA